MTIKILKAKLNSLYKKGNKLEAMMLVRQYLRDTGAKEIVSMKTLKDIFDTRFKPLHRKSAGRRIIEALQELNYLDTNLKLN